jgi:hypothetical protein
VTPVRQRVGSDCGIAALASYAAIAYEDAYVAVSKVEPNHRGKRGLYNRELIRAAGVLRIRLQPTRRFDLDDDEGILRIRFNGPTGAANPGGHFVAVIESVILDPADATPCAWRDYLSRHDARPCTLLRERA